MLLGLWFGAHVGWIVPAVALATAVGVSIAGWLGDKVKAGFKATFEERMAMPASVHILLGALLLAVLFTFSCSSAVVTLDDDYKTSVALWPDGDSSRAEYLSKLHPVRSFGFAWGTVPSLASAAYQFRGTRRYRFFFPRTLGYPSDFVRRGTLFLLPAGSFYRNVREQPYRLYIVAPRGDTLARTSVGGANGPWSVWVGGVPPRAEFDTLISDYVLQHRDTVSPEMVSAWKVYQHIDPVGALPADSVTVVVDFQGGTPANLFRQVVHLKEPVALISP